MEKEVVINPIEGLATKYLQERIDKAYELNTDLYISKGLYLTGPIFLHDGMNIYFEDGAIFKATTNEKMYQDIFTRVAGIEMNWYPAVINIIGKSNVNLNGHLIIDGSGRYWWGKYWGSDTTGGMRKDYDAKGLRWACDYDCKRPRNLLIQNSFDININGLESRDSGFWNIHILYSNNVVLNSIIVNSDQTNSPSTDGIDIDSSNNIQILNCVTNCNDDSISIKSGRDADGTRVSIPSRDILIKDCVINKGFGITIGSEISAGVYDITIDNILYNGTDCGFRIKSARPRRGFVKNIIFKNIKMTNVKYLFHINLDWNPLYSYCILPENYNGEIKDYYKTLTTKISDNIPLTKVSNIRFENIVSENEDNYNGISRLFNISGYETEHISNLEFKNIIANVKEFGILEYVDNVKFINSDFSINGINDNLNDEYDNR